MGKKDIVQILDLFSGATGFYYVLHINSNLETLLANDILENALETISYSFRTENFLPLRMKFSNNL
jgi:hypothetical protein